MVTSLAKTLDAEFIVQDMPWQFWTSAGFELVPVNEAEPVLFPLKTTAVVLDPKVALEVEETHEAVLSKLIVPAVEPYTPPFVMTAAFRAFNCVAPIPDELLFVTDPAVNSRIALLLLVIDDVEEKVIAPELLFSTFNVTPASTRIGHEIVPVAVPLTERTAAVVSKVITLAVYREGEMITVPVSIATVCKKGL